MRFHAAVLAVACGLTLLPLIGCSATESLNEQDQVAFSEGVQYDIDLSSFDAMRDSTPTHVDFEDENVSIHADVSIVGEPASAVFAGRLVDWDERTLNDLFIHDQPVSKETANNSGLEYTAVSNSAFSLGYQPGSIYYQSANKPFHYYDVPLLYCTTEEAWQQTFPPVDINGLTMEKAQVQCQKTLAALGLEAIGEPQAYSLTTDRLNQATRQNAAGLSADDLPKISQEDLSRTYTAEDEVIVVSLNLACNGAPLSKTSFHDARSDRYLPSSSAEFWISPAGLQSVSVINAFQAEDPGKDLADQVIPLDDAVNAVVEKYRSVVTEKALNFSEIRLEYTAYPGSEDVSASPCYLTWVFSPGGDRESYDPVVRVNAVNGEVS